MAMEIQVDTLTHLSIPFFLRLVDSFIGVSHHSNQHIHEQQCHQYHVDDENYLSKLYSPSVHLSTVHSVQIQSVIFTPYEGIRELRPSSVNFTPETRSSAVAERPHNALCHWIFRQATQGHSGSFEI